uniref:Inter-alpha-trypsin inhibitor heavy chain family member 6 n=1 Tax=Neogobius melanostomus TaxID=47308 RepID=A0A8C6UAU9_9GOBI
MSDFSQSDKRLEEFGLLPRMILHLYRSPHHLRTMTVTEYHVRSSVVSRYAVTTVHSSVWNQLSVTKEAAFEVDLPSAAFISNFTIAFQDTQSREIERFRVAVSAPPGARLSFCLTYEELLIRRLGRYELSLGLRAGQPVENLTVEVTVSERTGLTTQQLSETHGSRLSPMFQIHKRDGDPPASTLIEKNKKCARIHYSPSVQQQTSLSTQGINADFIVHYDVELRDIMGDIQVYDGYFVHYFAPRGLPVVPKDVIFVIDISGSMIGTKIKQTKQAMGTILGDLREGDHFNIITFSDRVQTWRKGRTVRATRQNVRDAKEFVKRISAEGWTNINAALISAARLVSPLSGSSSRRVPLVIFLTDGEATIGVTAGDTILSNARQALSTASLFGLAFGDDADFLLLKRLALDNRGVARMVYEDADAALQLKGFYDEVASPLLSDIQLTYLDEQAFDVTCSLFPNYFQGSELVVAGRVKPGVKDLKVAMSAVDSKQRVKLENDVSVAGSQESDSLDECVGDLEGMSSFVHRLWAYSTIKELLLAKLNTTDPSLQRLLADKATNLSLRYNFVTPVTSLVVVKPDADETTTNITESVPATAPPRLVSPLASPSLGPAPGAAASNEKMQYCSGCLFHIYNLHITVSVRVSVDGDPHFVVQLPKLHESLCFTVDGRAKDVLRSSLTSGIIVDGHLIGAPCKPGAEERPRTYFDRLVISMATGGSADVLITVSLDSVVLEGEGRDKLPVNQQGSITRQEVTVAVDNHHSCWIELSRGVRFLVLFHYYKHPSYLQMAHLGFYINNGQGLSGATQGLLGNPRLHDFVYYTYLQNIFKTAENLEQCCTKEKEEVIITYNAQPLIQYTYSDLHYSFCLNN